MRMQHVFITAFVVAAALIASIAVTHTKAGDTQGGAGGYASTTAEILNTAPSVDSVRISNIAYGNDDFVSGVLPDVGANKRIHITGVVSDANGESDISKVSTTFYRKAKTENCTPNKNHCYKIPVCSIDTTYGDNTEAAFDCEIVIAYWIDATDNAGRFPSDNWNTFVTVTDAADVTSSNSRETEVKSLLALNIPDSTNYGHLTLGEITTVSQQTTLKQRGNMKADVEVSGTAMLCDTMGVIPVEKQRWSLTDVAYNDPSAKPLSVTPTLSGLNVQYRESETEETTATIYWRLAVPYEGVKGSCSGTNTLSVVAGS